MSAKLMQSSVALLFFLLPLLALAQGTCKDVEDKNRILISGSVRNSFTGKGVGNARISVFGEDGTEIHKNVLLLTFGNRSRNGNEFRVSLPQGRFRFHVECDGYKPFDYWCDVDIRRKKMIKLPDFMIQRDFSFIKEVQLGEASVTATKVKMYYNGDTLVYNADAFKLPDGSMLDDLIRQLPGAELKDNGEIYINGRKLDFLLLNGREFFSGNNKVMLENLPYYIVDKLKVYEQQSVRSEALGHQVDEKLYVMDVRVKKSMRSGISGMWKPQVAPTTVIWHDFLRSVLRIILACLYLVEATTLTKAVNRVRTHIGVLRKTRQGQNCATMVVLIFFWRTNWKVGRKPQML